MSRSTAAPWRVSPALCVSLRSGEQCMAVVHAFKALGVEEIKITLLPIHPRSLFYPPKTDQNRTWRRQNRSKQETRFIEEGSSSGVAGELAPERLDAWMFGKFRRGRCEAEFLSEYFRSEGKCRRHPAVEVQLVELCFFWGGYLLAK